jgi:hypothetical protein
MGSAENRAPECTSFGKPEIWSRMENLDKDIGIFVVEVTNTMHWFVPLLYSIYWLLHVSAVVCYHQGASWIRLSYLKYRSNGWYIIECVVTWPVCRKHSGTQATVRTLNYRNIIKTELKGIEWKVVNWIKKLILMRNALVFRTLWWNSCVINHEKLVKCLIQCCLFKNDSVRGFG